VGLGVGGEEIVVVVSAGVMCLTTTVRTATLPLPFPPHATVPFLARFFSRRSIHGVSLRPERC
jgi:hypothetical protein